MPDDPRHPDPNADHRLQGLRRWEQWLAGRLSPNAVVREEAAAGEANEAVWRVGFRDGGRARVRVPDRVVRMSEEEFDVLTDRLERIDWIRRLRDAGSPGIRIQREGTIEDVEPDDGTGTTEARGS